MKDQWDTHSGDSEKTLGLVDTAPTVSPVLSSHPYRSIKTMGSDGNPMVTASNVDAEAQNNNPDRKTSTTLASASPRAVPFFRRLRRFSPSPANMKDGTIAISDGIVVPFAVAAGLTAFGDTKIVVSGSLAELFAGSISMGLGGLLGSKSDSLEYGAKRRDTQRMVRQNHIEVAAIVDDMFTKYLSSAVQAQFVTEFRALSDEQKCDYIMEHHYHLSEPSSKLPWISALIFFFGYLLGGLVSLVPYLCVKEDQADLALYISIGVVGFVLLAFGWTKTCSVIGWRGKDNMKAGAKGAMEMFVVGCVAMGVAFGINKGLNRNPKG